MQKHKKIYPGPKIMDRKRMVITSFTIVNMYQVYSIYQVFIILWVPIT